MCYIRIAVKNAVKTVVAEIREIKGIRAVNAGKIEKLVVPSPKQAAFPNFWRKRENNICLFLDDSEKKY